jgi:hypothetical protein
MVTDLSRPKAAIGNRLCQHSARQINIRWHSFLRHVVCANESG